MVVGALLRDGPETAQRQPRDSPETTAMLVACRNQGTHDPDALFLRSRYDDQSTNGRPCRPADPRDGYRSCCDPCLLCRDRSAYRGKVAMRHNANIIDTH